MSTFAVTKFVDFAAETKMEHRLTAEYLAERIRATTAPQKGRLPWLKLARFGNRHSTRRSLRHDGNMLAISGIEADYDGEIMPFDEAWNLLAKQGIASIIYTSPSHTADAPRWRVLCPFSEELPPPRRNHHLGRLNGLFRGIFSGESWTLSQSYYFGSVNRNPSHRVAVIEGWPIDLHDDLDEIWLGKPGACNNADNADNLAGKDVREDAELVRSVVTGEQFHCELRALAARYIGRNIPPDTVIELLRGIMLSHPETERDKRWLDRFDSIGKLVASAARKYQGGDERKPDPRRTAIARAAFDMLRKRMPADELVAELHRLNEQLPGPLAAEVVRETAIWCARHHTGVRHAG